MYAWWDFHTSVVWLAEPLPAVGSAGSVLLTAGWPSWRGWQPVVGIGWQDTRPMESHHSTDGASPLDLKDTNMHVISQMKGQSTLFSEQAQGLWFTWDGESAAISFALCFRSIKAGVCVGLNQADCLNPRAKSQAPGGCSPNPQPSWATLLIHSRLWLLSREPCSNRPILPQKPSRMQSTILYSHCTSTKKSAALRHFHYQATFKCKSFVHLHTEYGIGTHLICIYTTIQKFVVSKI